MKLWFERRASKNWVMISCFQPELVATDTVLYAILAGIWHDDFDKEFELVAPRRGFPKECSDELADCLLRQPTLEFGSWLLLSEIVSFASQRKIVRRVSIPLSDHPEFAATGVIPSWSLFPAEDDPNEISEDLPAELAGIRATPLCNVFVEEAYSKWMDPWLARVQELARSLEVKEDEMRIVFAFSEAESLD
jgi:hypothetical protein